MQALDHADRAPPPVLGVQRRVVEPEGGVGDGCEEEVEAEVGEGRGAWLGGLVGVHDPCDHVLEVGEAGGWGVSGGCANRGAQMLHHSGEDGAEILGRCVVSGGGMVSLVAPVAARL